MLSIDDANMSR